MHLNLYETFVRIFEKLKMEQSRNSGRTYAIIQSYVRLFVLGTDKQFHGEKSHESVSENKVLLASIRIDCLARVERWRRGHMIALPPADVGHERNHSATCRKG